MAGNETCAEIGEPLVRKIGVLLLLLAVAGCWSVPSESQTKKTDQTKQATSAPQKKKRQAYFATDNRYMIPKDRLERMEQGGAGAY